MKIKNIYNMVKLLFSISKEVDDMKEKKSELWVTVLSIVITVAFALKDMIEPETLGVIITILSSVYTIARTIVKVTKTPKDDEIVAKIEEILNKKLGK